MLRRSLHRLFVARSECDVTKGDAVVRLKVIPNPVTSYTKLPASLQATLGLVDTDAEALKQERRKAVGELLRSGEDSSRRAAMSLLDNLRAKMGRSTDLSGPVTLRVVGKEGEVREITTFVTFGTDKDEATPLGKACQLGLKDLKDLKVAFDFGSFDLSFGSAMGGDRPASSDAPSGQELSEEAAADAAQDAARGKVEAGSRALAGNMMPGRQSFESITAPEVQPTTELKYGSA